MITVKPRSINDCQVTATATATLLYTLIDTASSSPSSANYYNATPSVNPGTVSEPRAVVNCVSLRAETNDFRCAIGATPTTAKGFLVKEGTRVFVTGDITQLKLIRTGSDATVEVGFYAVGPSESQSANTDIVNIQVEDIEIGAVELKNATDDTRAKIGAGNAAAVADNAVYVADANVLAKLVAGTASPLAPDTGVSGTVAATNGAGGTQIVAANAKRVTAYLQNNGSVDVYFGTGTVTSSFPKIVPGGDAMWYSKEAIKVLSSGVNCNIAYHDFSNL